MTAQQFERYKRLSDTIIVSKELGFDKHIRVTVPVEWQKDVSKKFPLIVVFDLQNSRSHDYILRTIDYLTSNEQMPSSVIVSVESEQAYRYLETLYPVSDSKGLAIKNEGFLFDELIPLAEKHYKAGAYRLLIGHSRYGYFTTSLLFSRTSQLNAVISLSPFFTQKNVNLVDSIGNLQDIELNASRYYRFGIGNDCPEDFEKMETRLKTFNNPVFDLDGYLFKEADHNVTPGLTIGRALYEVFEKWAAVQNKYFTYDQDDTGIIQTLENEIRRSYGSTIDFSLGVLNGKGWYYYNKGAYNNAIEAWDRLVRSYPNFSEAYLYIIDAQHKLKMDSAAMVESFKASLARSQVYPEEEKRELMQELEKLLK
jgi:predicted alpha/beta superfamily hydrolase